MTETSLFPPASTLTPYKSYLTTTASTEVCLKLFFIDGILGLSNGTTAKPTSEMPHLVPTSLGTVKPDRGRCLSPYVDKIAKQATLSLNISVSEHGLTPGRCSLATKSHFPTSQISLIITARTKVFVSF